MKPLAPEYKRALYWALGLHLSILIMMLLQIDFPWQHDKPALSYAMQNEQVIQAQIVPQAMLDKRENEKKRELAEQKQKELDLAQAREQKREQEAARVAAEKEKQVQATRLAEAAKKKQAEALRVVELEKQKQADAAKQKAAADAQAKAAQEQAKQQQLAEQQALAAQQQASLQQAILTEIERYTLMVKQKVMQNWLVQRGFEGLVTQLHVRVAPGGTVLDVQITSKSGNEALDRSAVSAVYRASPLPVPTDPAVFESFRDLRLILRPEDVLG